MTKHFRVIEGGAARPRYGRPTKDPRYWPAQDRPRRRHSGGGDYGGDYSSGSSNSLWTIAPLALVLSVATFWGVWTMTAPAPAPLADTERASFGFCHMGGGMNCVVDGDTLYYQGMKIRVADIDAPETHDPMCESEAKLGAAATRRFQALVNAGPFALAPNPDGRDEDMYGRKLRIVTRGGESLGGVLVDEGLARWYAGGRRPWC